MLKNWGAWLGIDKGNSQEGEECESAVDAAGINKGTNVSEDAQPPRLLHTAKGFSGYMYNMASSASKKLSESVSETAQTLKKSVEEGKMTGIMDKTILGDFQKEQERFVQEKNAKKSGAAVPPWVGYNQEESMQQQILALSADKRNFLRDPPAGVHFSFDSERMYPVAMVMLEEDQLLQRMRFHLVPRQVKEEVFWKNYFYRVSLIKQSAQLTALAAQQAAERSDQEQTATHHQANQQKDAVKQITPPATHSAKPKSSEAEGQISTSPLTSDFVSDAFDSCEIDEDDLRKEMEQLVLDKRAQAGTQQQDDTPDWERELQEELQEYDVLADNHHCDDNWDKEIEDMLKGDT